MPVSRRRRWVSAKVVNFLWASQHSILQSSCGPPTTNELYQALPLNTNILQIHQRTQIPKVPAWGGWNITKHCAALLKLLPTLSIFIEQETQEATILESSQFSVEKYLPALFKIQIQSLATHFQLSIFLQCAGNGGH